MSSCDFERIKQIVPVESQLVLAAARAFAAATEFACDPGHDSPQSLASQLFLPHTWLSQQGLQSTANF